jgi:hypothetical protein
MSKRSRKKKVEDTPPQADAPAAVKRRDVRPYVYCAFDFVFALVYAGLLLQVPNRHPAANAILWSTVFAVALAGAGMLVRNRWGWRAAAAGCGLLLVVTVTVLVLLVASASFLSGVYGSMGQGAAMFTLLGGALVVELCGLLPAFQLKFLMTHAGRRHFGKA